MSSTVLRKFTHIKVSISWRTKQSRNQCNTNVIDGFSLIPNQYISNISNIYNTDVNLTLASQTIFDHIFQIRSRIIYFHTFCYIPYIFCLFLYEAILHLLQIWKGFGIYFKLIPDWIKSTQSRILFTPQYRTRIQNQIRNTTWRSILK